MILVKKNYKFNKYQMNKLKQIEVMEIKNYNNLLLIKMKFRNLIHKH